MRAKVPDVLEKGRVRDKYTLPGEWFGRFVVRCPTGATLLLIVSAGDAEGWEMAGWPLPLFDHVSVSVRDPNGPLSLDRCPTWDEMCFVKDLCFEPEECVIQYHPPKSKYVNCHPFTLHLWRPVGVELPQPPMQAIGPPGS